MRLCSWVFRCLVKRLEGPARTAEADGREEKGRGNDETDPKTRTAQKSQRIELGEPIDHGDVGAFWMLHDDESLLEAAGQALNEHAREKRGIEREFFNRADGEPG